MKRTISFIVHPGFELLDLSGPCSAFNIASELYGAAYHVRVISVAGGPVRDRAGVVIESEHFGEIRHCDTVLAVGGPVAHQYALNETAIALIQDSSRKAARVASVCTGAFLLAAAGILNNRRATTHWRYAGLLQTQYPSIEVDADRIFINDGGIWLFIIGALAASPSSLPCLIWRRRLAVSAKPCATPRIICMMR
jgi:transcriptional regulator GlxA family with amidase domain